MQFNERLKSYRKDRGLTQEELADKIHVSRSAVAKWENGLGLPSEDSLDAIAAFFGVRREELLADRETASIIVEKNGKLSRQKIWLVGLIIFAGLLIISAILLGVFLSRERADGFESGNGGNGGIYEEGSVAEGIIKDDIYTWFDAAKTNLPSLEKCKEITKGMSLNQVITKLGKPQREIGYGTLVLQFDVDDGSVLTVSFFLDTEKAVNQPSVTSYDYWFVLGAGFDREIPDVYFPYNGKLSDFYPWVDALQVGDIVKVRCERAFLGVAPGRLKDIAYSTDAEDIKNAYRLLLGNLTAVSDAEGAIEGGGYVRYDFYTADNKTYSVTVENDIIRIKNQNYKFVDNFYYEFRHSDLDCHSFITYGLPKWEQYEIYTYATERVEVGSFGGIGEFEFCVYGGLMENAPKFYLKSSFGVNLLILSDRLFMIEHDNNTVVYEITGEKDFSWLFAENGG